MHESGVALTCTPSHAFYDAKALMLVIADLLLADLQNLA